MENALWAGNHFPDPAGLKPRNFLSCGASTRKFRPGGAKTSEISPLRDTNLGFCAPAGQNPKKSRPCGAKTLFSFAALRGKRPCFALIPFGSHWGLNKAPNGAPLRLPMPPQWISQWGPHWVPNGVPLPPPMGSHWGPRCGFYPTVLICRFCKYVSLICLGKLNGTWSYQ